MLSPIDVSPSSVKQICEHNSARVHDTDSNGVLDVKELQEILQVHQTSLPFPSRLIDQENV